MEFATILAIAIIFCGVLLQGIFGFGSALLAMPLLSLIMDLKVVTPTFALLMATATTLIFLTSWRQVEFTAIWRLLVTTIPGVFGGAWLLKVVPQIFILRGIGLFLIIFGGYSLGKFKLPKLGDRAAYGFGLIAGIFGGAYNLNGPPVVIYGNMCRWNPQKFRATLQCYFSISSISILISHGLSGFWTKQVLTLYIWTLPAVAIALLLGREINRRLPVQRFQQFIYFLLIGLGVLLWVAN
ncbi:MULTISPECIES: sulfite exporter TauE/SafE family protein [Spirulina sp. CCY15215]|uniref:sulfite exporter TauE/SafE family protein n=1 Tax=Spirulina sp. CCY15215 TaxID=2767591 RepID=UPI001950607B|nr:sulfite exporter TauE/SafE family protein [Spirulina major]